MKYWILTLALLGQAVFAQEALQFGPVHRDGVKAVDDIALVINSEGITRKQLAKEMAQARAQLPKKLPLSKEALNQQLLENVIMKHLLGQLKQQGNVKASPQEIDRAIASIAAKNGVSVSALLKKVKRSAGLNERAYRSQIADSIAQEKVKQMLLGGSGIHVNQADIDAQMAQIQKQNQVAVHLQDMLLPIPGGNPQQRGEIIRQQMQAVSQAMKKSGNDLQQVAAAVKGARFNDLGVVNMAKMPARFANAVSNLSGGAVVSKPVIDSDGLHFLKVVSKQSSSGKTVIPEANVADIVLKAPNQQSLLKQKAVIDNIYQQLQQGASFAELAQRYSQDGLSAVRGGEQGWVSAAQVSPEFAKVMLSVPLNQISAPFMAGNAWHIIKVSDRRQVDRSEDMLRAQVRDQLYAKYLEDAWQKALQELRQRAYIQIH